ncbi:MAG TPA: hypothetical protein DCO75_09880 [Fibrobacteres bacterium]|jgi:hypothetical protein|nr:hypothetical protein [Fibrobacterota bacterium]
MENGRIALADAVRNLREQLQEAMEEGADKKLRFEIKDLELELKCGVTRKADADAGVSFWVLDLGAKGSLADSKTQTIKLKLSPVAADGNVVLLRKSSKRAG